MEQKKRGRPRKTPKPTDSASPTPLVSKEEAEEKLLLLKQEQARLLQIQVDLMEGLPHLHAQKMYKWQREFYESRNYDNFLVAANQIGKSSIQIRKCILWATEPELWPQLWRRRPTQFWYLYPDKNTATSEFEQKWVKEFLPRGAYKDHPQYGWKAIYQGKSLQELRFNSGVSVYFKTYSQNASYLQGGTVYAIFTDEELPVDLYDELNARRRATDGYFHMAFTATLGQEEWRRTVEDKGLATELYPHAFKRQVSLWDCQFYEDGTPSHWTPEKILKAIASCHSEAEVQRRIYGRFVLDSGLRYSGFTREVNFAGNGPVPSNWLWYGGADVGAGGTDNHPASIVFVAISPDFKKGRVVEGWRGNDQITTASDVLDKFVEMRGEREFIGQFYDWHSKDFLTMAQRRGESFLPAEKNQEIGVQILNALFKNKMLLIDEKAELAPLVDELTTLQITTDKRKAKDDFIDALRYAVTRIPWDWSAVGVDFKHEVKLTKPRKKTEFEMVDEERFKGLQETHPWQNEDIAAELNFWNELYEP